MPFIEWAVFALLGRMHKKKSEECGLRFVNAVYGLTRTGHCDERYLMHIFGRTCGSFEIFTHPDTATAAGQRELEALISAAARAELASHGAVLAGYRELFAEDSAMENV